MNPRTHAALLVVAALAAAAIGVATGAVAANPPFVGALAFALCVALAAVAQRADDSPHIGGLLPIVGAVQAATLAAFGAWAAMLLVVTVATLRLGAVWSDRGRAARDVVLSVLAVAAAGVTLSWVRGTSLVPASTSAMGLIPAWLTFGLVFEGGRDVMPGRGGAGRPRLRIRLVGHLAAAALAVMVTTGVEQYGAAFVALLSLPLWVGYGAWQRARQAADTHSREHACLATIDLAVCTVCADGTVGTANPAFCALVARPEALVTHRPLSESLGATWTLALQERLVDARRSGTRVAVALPPATDGAPARSVEAVLVPSGTEVTLSVRDVSLTCEAQANAARAEARVALLADGAHDGLWEWDLSARAIYFSDRWKTMTGLPLGPHNRVEDWLHRVHPDDLVSLTESIEKHLSGRTEYLECEHRIRLADGTYRWFLCRGKASGGAGHRLRRLAGSLTDISDRADAQDRIRAAALRDPLTGLQNRTVFVERLGRLLRDFKDKRHGRFAILYLDLDRFKVVNDSLGHLVGDELLIAVSRRLESCLRGGDALARLGGDEFVILIDRTADENQVNAIALRLQGVLAEPFSIGGREVFTSASIGIALSVAEYDTPDDMMRAADMAMYHAKARGKARHETFDADMQARAVDRLHLENALRHAVANHELDVHFQPIVSLSSRRCVGFESLVRWSRDGKPVSPALFIPVAEELGLVETIGTKVLQEACRRFAEWRTTYPDSGLEYITVNVSPRQLMQPTFPRLVEQAVRESGLRPEDVRLEITETALMDAPQNVAALLGELRRFGAKVYLDDFGTGYSSLSHLHRLPVDALKIDRSFVMSLLLTDRPAIVESILALAKTLNTGVVAEGVESHSQALELLRLGCQYAQGFYFSRPIPASAVEALLQADQPLGDQPPGTAPRLTNRLQPVAARRA